MHLQLRFSVFDVYYKVLFPRVLIDNQKVKVNQRLLIVNTYVLFPKGYYGIDVYVYIQNLNIINIKKMVVGNDLYSCTTIVMHTTRNENYYDSSSVVV